jgi:glycosyltransferase involved in cell wall biosynthesis
MKYFCHEVLPLIRLREPHTTLSIVGRAPTPAVQRLADLPGIDVTGRVDDVRDYIGRAGIYVVPIRIGGGTRLKIFEAMGMARAVVSTTVGAEGLPVTDGRDIVLADSAPDFADSVLALMHDPARRVQLEQAARDLVVTRYDWSAVAGQLEDALVTAAAKRTIAAA